MASPSLNLEVLLTLGVVASALGLFIFTRLAVEVVGLAVLLALVLLGLISPQEGLSGFSNEATVTVGAMLVLSAALLRTGAVDMLSRFLARLAGKSEARLVAAVLLVVVPLSAFINNTAVAAVFLPVVLGLCRQANLAPSRVLMPLSFGSQLGGTLTLLGTSTNLLVAGLALDLGLPRIGLFDITLPAAALMLVGVAYLLTVGRWLAPRRTAVDEATPGHEWRHYLGAVVVDEKSPLVGERLEDVDLKEKHQLEVIGLERQGARVEPNADQTVAAGDTLLVQGSVGSLKLADEIPGIHLLRTTHFHPARDERMPVRLAEVMVPPRSQLIHKQLASLELIGWHGLSVLAVQRQGMRLQGRLEDVRLKQGDLLLVEGTDEGLARLHHGRSLAVLGPVTLPAKRLRKAKIAVPIIAAVVLLAAFEVLPIVVSALLGVLATVLTGCITPREAYEQVDWGVLILLGTLIPLEIAIQQTGTAALLAAGLSSLTGAFGPYGTLAAVYLATSLLTELTTNNAAAVVMVPIAAAIGNTLGLSPLPFVIAVMFAGSNAFLTPIGYQTNTFIYRPGGYRFSDFIRVGGPLNLLLLPIAVVVIPLFFPFSN